MPKRIVFAVWGSLGDLHPYLAIAHELQARGHRCVIATTKFHRERVEAAQLEFAPMGPHLDADPVLMKRSLHLRRGPRFLLRDLVIPYTRQSVVETMTAIAGADLLVTHPIAYGAQLVARKTEIRWASTALAPAGMFSACEPSVRMQSPLLSKLEAAGPWLDRALLKIAHRTTERWTAPITKVQNELGLASNGNPIFEGQFSPQLTLAMFSPLFGKAQPDWPPNTVITGFPFYPEAAPMDAALRRFLDGGVLPVIFTLGSAASAAPRNFFDESLKAIARLKCRAVLIVGSLGPNQFSSGLPANVAAFPYAPYDELFSRGAVNVHHGGIGTTAQALRSGRPMLVVPFAFDQPDNAARAGKLGVARNLFIHQYKASRVIRELEPLLKDTKYSENAAAISEHLRNEDGVKMACIALEKLLAS
jgi:UDP:flavonoid glycosyltransferase YjiC (YdhE family)